MSSETATFDIGETGVRPLNEALHDAASLVRRIDVLRPGGQHNVAVGARSAVLVDIHGHVGYYAAGMNQAASIRIRGNAGKGVAENIMSGTVEVLGNASDAVASSGHGGLVVVRGDAATRCGISMKGVDIVVQGSIGHYGAFMAQAGALVVCGDAGPGLGDSLYEAVIYVAGRIEGLGADAQREPLGEDDRLRIAALLDRTHITAPLDTFQRVGSARRLYHFRREDDRVQG